MRRVGSFTRAAFTSVVAIGALASGGSACKDLDPQTGDLRMECVDADSDPARPVIFKTDIRPIMNGEVIGTKGCKACHYETVGTHEGLLATGRTQPNGLRLQWLECDLARR